MDVLLCAFILAFGTGCGDNISRVEKPANANARKSDSPLPMQPPWFADVTSAAGIDFAHVRAINPQFWLPEITSGGVAWIDFDNDGDSDLYFIQGGQLDPTAATGPGNVLYENVGDGTFSDVTLRAGVSDKHYGMGVAAVDLDHDGDLDLFMTHLFDETNTLYTNNDGIFKDVTASSGLAAPSVNFTGFGMGFADFNHDGFLDLYIANRRVTRALEPLSNTDPFAEPNQLFQGQGDGRFLEVMPRGGTQPVMMGSSRAVAFADYNGDGGTDVVVVNSEGRATLLKNTAAASGNWIRFEIVRRGGLDAIGALIRIKTDRGVQQRIVQRAYSFFCKQ